MDDTLLLGYIGTGKALEEFPQDGALDGLAKLPQVVNNQILRASL